MSLPPRTMPRPPAEYLDIIARIGEANPTLWVPKFGTKDMVKHYIEAANFSICSVITSDKEIDQRLFLGFVDFMVRSKLDLIFNLSLDRLVGLVIQSPEELETFKRGLAVAAILNIKAKEREKAINMAIAAFEARPWLMMVRLFELFEIEK